MEPNNTVFMVEDLNILIKLYAYQIQQRFQQINNYQRQNYNHGQAQQPLADLLNKYQGYTTINTTEIKYIEKLVQRILQIFSFFKIRTKHQNLINIFVEKINSKFEELLEKKPIQVYEIFSHINDMIRPGFFNQRLISQKKALMKINSKQNRQERIRSIKVMSVMKRGDSGVKLGKTGLTKTNKDDIFNKNYSMLGIDRMHFMRSYENQNRVKKDLIQRNQGVNISIKNYEKQFRKNNPYQNNQQKTLTQLKQRKSNKKDINLRSLVKQKKRLYTAQRNKDNQNNSLCF